METFLVSIFGSARNGACQNKEDEDIQLRKHDGREWLVWAVRHGSKHNIAYGTPSY